MANIQDPYGVKDIKLSSNWDFVLTKKPTGNADLAFTDENNIDTLKQLIRMCLNTAVGSYKTNPTFGASPKGRKTLVTSTGIGQLKSYIYQNMIFHD